MATALDKKLVPKVLSIINRVGRNMDFSFPLAKSYDPATGAGSESIFKTVTAKASPPIDFEQRYVNDDSVKRGDVKIFLAAKNLSFTPIIDMEVKFDGISFKAIAVLPIYSGEQVAAFEVQLRK